MSSIWFGKILFLIILLFIILKQEPGVTGKEILHGIRFVRRMFHFLLIGNFQYSFFSRKQLYSEFSNV
jgi:hypothetical protein